MTTTSVSRILVLASRGAFGVGEFDFRIRCRSTQAARPKGSPVVQRLQPEDGQLAFLVKQAEAGTILETGRES